MQTNTQISYYYRDGANYKQNITIIISGEIEETEKNIIIDKLDEQLWFIPSQVGLPNLQHQMIHFPSKDDHVWHELHLIDICVTNEIITTNHNITNIAELINNFKQAHWDVKGAMQEIGLNYTHW